MHQTTSHSTNLTTTKLSTLSTPTTKLITTNLTRSLTALKMWMVVITLTTYLTSLTALKIWTVVLLHTITINYPLIKAMAMAVTRKILFRMKYRRTEWSRTTACFWLVLHFWYSILKFLSYLTVINISAICPFIMIVDKSTMRFFFYYLTWFLELVSGPVSVVHFF